MKQKFQKISLVLCILPDETKTNSFSEEQQENIDSSNKLETWPVAQNKLNSIDSSPTVASENNIFVEQETIEPNTLNITIPNQTPLKILKCHALIPYAQLTLIIGCWYAISMTITALNKCLFDTLQFNFPLLVTFIHFLCISLFLIIVFNHPQCSHRRPATTLKNYFKCIVPIAICGSLEVAMSNLAYAMVSLSTMTVMKSTLVVVTYLVAVVAGLDKFCWKLFFVVLMTVGSIGLTVPGMEIRNPIGIIFLSGAVFAGAIRWVVSSYQIREQHYNPWQMMFLTQPVSTLCLVPPAFFIDFNMAIETVKTTYLNEQTKYNLISIITLVWLTVMLAALLIYIEYKVLERISSVSLTLAGVGKEVLTIIMSVAIFGEHVNFKTCIGIASSILAIIAYSKIRISMRVNETSVLVNDTQKTSFLTIGTHLSLVDTSEDSEDLVSSSNASNNQTYQQRKMEKTGTTVLLQYSPLGIEDTTSTAFTEP